MNRLLPIPILLTSYNRKHFLEKAIERINSDTLYPFYLIVVDNASTDGSHDYIKSAKVNGKIFDHLFLPKNVGQSMALNRGLELVEYWHNRRRPMDDLIITTNEDIYPPHLSPCWLERMLHLFKTNEPEGLGALAMRIQRTPRADIDEEKEIIYWKKGIPSVFRMMRRSDLAQLGNDPFGNLRKWDSNATADKYQFFIKKRYGLATHLYADHAGFMEENKGYDLNDTSYFTYASNKVSSGKEKPYPEIDEKSNLPTKINHGVDTHEQAWRAKYWGQYGYYDSNPSTGDYSVEKLELIKDIPEGHVLEIGVSGKRINERVNTVDVCPGDDIDMVIKGDDLWWIKSGEIDGIVSTFFVERIPDTKRLLTEWSRVLKTGGILAFTVSDMDGYPDMINSENIRSVFTINTLERIIKFTLGHELIRLEKLSCGKIICVSKKL